MIDSAEEFVRLRTSHVPSDHHRAAWDHASLSVWAEIVERYPDMRVWVAHNKTSPVEILRLLALDDAPEVRFAVAMVRRLDRGLFELLSMDEDETVRCRIAAHPKVPDDIAMTLTTDGDEMVRIEAIKQARNRGLIA
jgi:hypothetical protein